MQGLLALGLGGLFGAGLGERAAAGGIVLPNAHNDYIFAVIGQEFGFLGAVAVIGLFVLLAYRGFRVALAAPDTFGGLLAAGITAWLCLQAFVNIGVVVTLAPRHGDHAPVRLGWRLLADRQPRRGGDPPVGLARDRGQRRLACEW